MPTAALTTRCVSAPPPNVQDTVRTKLASIARQTGGLGLFSAFDGTLNTVPGAPNLAGMAGNNVNHLSWSPGSNGGSTITGYNLYRSTATNSETLYQKLGAV